MADNTKDTAKGAVNSAPESPPKAAAKAPAKAPPKAANEAPAKAPTKAPAKSQTKKAPAKAVKRRTVRSVLREVFEAAPGDLLETMENKLDVDTLTALGKLHPIEANQMIYDSFVDYAQQVVAGKEKMPQAFEEKLREFAENQSVSYDSMLVPRGTQYLINAMYSLCGAYGYQQILEAL